MVMSSFSRKMKRKGGFKVAKRVPKEFSLRCLLLILLKRGHW